MIPFCLLVNFLHILFYLSYCLPPFPLFLADIFRLLLLNDVPLSFFLQITTSVLYYNSYDFCINDYFLCPSLLSVHVHYFILSFLADMIFLWKTSTLIVLNSRFKFFFLVPLLAIVSSAFLNLFNTSSNARACLIIMFEFLTLETSALYKYSSVDATSFCQ